MADLLSTLLNSLQGRITTTFDAVLSSGKLHEGVDIAAPAGTPVYAAASGKVDYARNSLTQPDLGANAWAIGGGNTVNVNLGNNLESQYAHLQSFVVSEGQQVSQGQLIGYIGQTGNATGPHLHFDVRNLTNNQFVNPSSVPIGSATSAPSNTVTLADLLGLDPNTTAQGNWQDIQDRINALATSGRVTPEVASNLIGAASASMVHGKPLGSITVDLSNGNDITSIGNIGNTIFGDVQGAIGFVGILLVGVVFIVIAGIVTLRK